MKIKNVILSRIRKLTIYEYILLAIVAIGAFLRFVNLSGLSPYTDAYVHLTAAKGLVNGQFPEYTRGISYTFIVAGFMKIFGASIEAARIPGVLAGTLTIISVYWLCNYFFEDKKAGLLAALLYSLSPWAIELSQNIRMYIILQAVMPFLMICVYKFMVNETKQLNNGFINNWLNFDYKYLILIIPLSLFAIDLHVVSLSVFLGVLLFIVLLAVYGKNKKYLSLIIVSIIGTIIVVSVFDNLINDIILEPLSSSNTQSWYPIYFEIIFDGIPMGLIVFIAGIILFNFYAVISEFNSINKKRIYILLIFAATLLLHVFAYKRYIKLRYISYLFPFAICSYSFFVVELINFTVKWFKKIKNVLTVAISLLLAIAIVIFIPITKTIDSAFFNSYGYSESGEYHEDMRGASNNVIPRLEENDVLISTLAEAVKFYTGRDDAIQLTPEMTADELLDIISQSGSGWYIGDERRHFSSGMGRDPGVLTLINNCFSYHSGLSAEGAYVFSWDIIQPEKIKDSDGDIISLLPETMEDNDNLIKLTVDYGGKAELPLKDLLFLQPYLLCEGTIIPLEVAIIKIDSPGVYEMTIPVKKRDILPKNIEYVNFDREILNYRAINETDLILEFDIMGLDDNNQLKLYERYEEYNFTTIDINIEGTNIK